MLELLKHVQIIKALFEGNSLFEVLPRMVDVSTKFKLIYGQVI